MAVSSGGGETLVYSFPFNGKFQEFVAPKSGSYQLEVWGAQGSGGDPSTDRGTSGRGGYSKGTVTLKSGESIYVYVGGKGAEGSRNTETPGGFNGGGKGLGNYANGGGGATHIAKANGLLSELTNLRDKILLVAGGGGSSGWTYNGAGYGGAGGAGGGLTGLTGTNYNAQTIATGGTQTGGGSPGIGHNGIGSTTGGVFGLGGNAWNYGGSGGAGAGGGGFFGGGGTGHGGGGAGGSSYIGGVNSGVTLAGNQTIPNPNGGTQIGHGGDGYARITILNSAPTKPTNLSVTGNIRPGENVTLSSSVATDPENDTVYYQFQYTLDAGQSWTTISTQTANSRVFTIPPGITAQNIQFRVRSFDQLSYSDYMNSSEYKVVYNTAPSAPTSVYIEGNPTFLTKGLPYRLHFTGATDVDNDTLKYHVQYTEDSGTTWNNIATAHTLNNYQWDVPLDLVGKVVQFRVRAFDGQVYSPYKTSANFTLNNSALINVVSPDSLVEYNEGDKVLIQGSASDSDPNQVVMVYYEVGDSGERIITSSMSGAIFPFEKSLTFKENALYDGETKVADKVVPNGVLGEVEFKFYAKDTIGAVSEVIKKTLTMRPNQNPILEIETNVATLEEGGSFKTAITAKDVDVDGLKVALKLRGYENEYEVDLGTSNGTDSIFGEVDVNVYGSTLYFGKDRTKPFNVAKLTTGTYYLDIVTKDEHGAQSDVKTVSITLTANRKPLLNMNTAPKIIVVTDGEFKFTGAVTDLDSYDKPYLTFGVRINSGDIISIPLNPETGEFEYAFKFGDADVGMKSLVFIANDGKEITSVTQDFEIVDEKILFEFENPIETDEVSHKVSILLGYHKSHDATLKVEMCNNGFDETPTWEDVTQAVIDNKSYSFLNEVKTADKWGINIRVELVKNNAPTIYVDRIGILFE